MAKSRNFSIYLLKTQYSAQNALKERNSLSYPIIGATNLPEGATIYLADNEPSQPWWKSYWGINQDLSQVSKGAIVFLPIDDKCFALTFGYTYHNLKTESYEYDFGLRATLNAVDPKKIRITDIFKPESAKRERIQSPIASDLTFFDIKSDESIVKRLTGVVRAEFQTDFQHVTGANNIRISSKVVASSLKDLCLKLYDLYKKDDFKVTFPDILNIIPIKDPSIIQELDVLLIKAFQEESIDLVLTIPEIIEHNSAYKIAYSGAYGPRKRYDNVFIGDYREFLKSRNIANVTIRDLQHHKLDVNDENDQTEESYPIYYCLLYDCEYNNNHYHFFEGHWYHIEQNYMSELKETIDPYFKENPSLIECNELLEKKYNESVVKNNIEYVCLDEKNISPKGQTQIEPCDLYTVDNDVAKLIHIKMSTRSASLSHLFHQGTTSVELLRQNEEIRNNLKDLVNPNQRTPIDEIKFSITYGIITKKSKDIKSDALPLFSRISLRRTIQSLKLMAIPCEIVLIKDNVNRKL